jgi:hypothetical protein
MIAHSTQTRRVGSERPPQSVTIETKELNIDVDDSIFAIPESTGGN